MFGPGRGRDHREGACRSGRSLLTDPLWVDRQSPALDQVAIPEERDWSIPPGGVGCCAGVAAEHISPHRTLLGLFTPRPGSAIGENMPAFPARAARSALAPRLSPAIPTARQTMLDQCFSDVVSVHGNARQLASVARQRAPPRTVPQSLTRRCFRTDLLATTGPAVDGEAVAVPAPESDILAGDTVTQHGIDNCVPV